MKILNAVHMGDQALTTKEIEMIMMNVDEIKLRADLSPFSKTEYDIS